MSEEIRLKNIQSVKAAVKLILSDIYAKYRTIMKSEKFDDNDRAFLRLSMTT